MGKLKFFASISLFTFSILQAVLLSAATARPGQEKKVFKLINQERVANGRRSLKWSSVAARLARKHSIKMARGKVPFGHKGVNHRWTVIKREVPRAISFAENVALNKGYSNPARRAVKGWLNSPGHFANIMGDFNYTGVGVASNSRGTYYFTQIFYKTAGTRNSLAQYVIRQTEVCEESFISNCACQDESMVTDHLSHETDGSYESSEL